MNQYRVFRGAETIVEIDLEAVSNGHFVLGTLSLPVEAPKLSQASISSTSLGALRTPAR